MGDIHSVSGDGPLRTVYRIAVNDLFIGQDGSYICDWSARGTIQDALNQSKCTTVVGGAGWYGVGVVGDYPKQWLITYDFTDTRHEFECVGGRTVFSCGSPVMGERGTSTLRGSGFAYVYFGEVDRSIKTKFKNLGASNI